MLAIIPFVDRIAVMWSACISTIVSNLLNNAVLVLTGPNEDPHCSVVEKRLSKKVAIEIVPGTRYVFS